MAAAETTGARISGPVPLPTRRRIYTVLRSPHVYKDSREQFESRVHQRLIDVKDLSAETVDKLMQLDLPAGVDVQVRRAAPRRGMCSSGPRDAAQGQAQACAHGLASWGRGAGSLEGGASDSPCGGGARDSSRLCQVHSGSLPGALGESGGPADKLPRALPSSVAGEALSGCGGSTTGSSVYNSTAWEWVLRGRRGGSMCAPSRPRRALRRLAVLGVLRRFPFPDPLPCK